jgi:hypothetical protein
MPKNWIFIIVTSIATVLIWIGLEVFLSIANKAVETDYTVYLTPVEPTINEEILKDVSSREEEYLPVKIEQLE